MEQNLPLGVLGGTSAALLGAVLWAAATVFSGWQIGWMAVGVGFLVGVSVKALGKGIDKAFGVAGAVLSLMGCLMGNLFAVCGFLSRQHGVPFIEILRSLDLSNIQELMIASFGPMDVVFYAIAVYEGYKLSFRQLTREELSQRISGDPVMI
ncbi:MAG: hypothetical protein JSV80_10600 [Acidobacteriota bacterium]|nr:MAG: hypothetical protein JSV80_10600 [Acidobacteriota bacterium]